MKKGNNDNQGKMKNEKMKKTEKIKNEKMGK